MLKYKRNTDDLMIEEVISYLKCPVFDTDTPNSAIGVPDVSHNVNHPVLIYQQFTSLYLSSTERIE